GLLIFLTEKFFMKLHFLPPTPSVDHQNRRDKKNPSEFFDCQKGKSKNADASEGFIKTPTRRREAVPTFDFGRRPAVWRRTLSFS
ncbi:MAG: hypothetical protein LUQ19_03770, partial [Methanoregula sp.]|nr:hypothetical protein [Methanoregula sp.]